MDGEVAIFIDLSPLPYGRSSHDIYGSQSTELWLVKSPAMGQWTEIYECYSSSFLHHISPKKFK